MKQNTLLFVLIALIISGCSVKYTQRLPGFQPGYVDEQIGENVYQVRIGEAWPKDWADLEKFAIYRAADVTKGKGKEYFVVLNASSQISGYAVSAPVTTTTNFNATKIGNTVYGQASSTSYGGGTSYIQGGWYYLDYKIIDDTDISKYDKVVSATDVINDLKYFIDKRR